MHSAFRPIWLVGAAVALLLILGLVHVFRGKPAPSAPQQVSAPAAASPAVIPDAPAVVVAPPSRSSQSAQPASPGIESATAAAPTHGPGWYVIAYTYNREGQARAKADRLERRHGGFHPVVFSPSGRGPYLVALGGPMSESEAGALMQRARHSGLPRDTFIRKY